MTRIIIYIITAWLMVGCTLSETLTQTVNRKPGILAKYQTTTNHSVHTYVFDNRGLLVKSYVMSANQILDTVRLLDGVPMFDYTIVTYSNSNRFAYRPLVDSVSKIDDIELTMVNSDPGTFMSGCDSVFYGMQTIKARRGEEQDVVATPRHLFYDVQVSVVGFTELTQPIADFAVEFRNIPLVFDSKGDGFNPTGRFRPVLIDNPNGEDGKHANLVLNRFSDAHKVQLHALSKGVSLGFKDITPSALGLTSDDGLQKIKVDMIMNTAAIAIFVNDWFVGEIQLSAIGG